MDHTRRRSQFLNLANYDYPTVEQDCESISICAYRILDFGCYTSTQQLSYNYGGPILVRKGQQKVESISGNDLDELRQLDGFEKLIKRIEHGLDIYFTPSFEHGLDIDFTRSLEHG